eukprot:CAMPEP_0170570474 /NCGR_PEP_ID=MMETSP0224-20130122/1130_1 /TAXON_ID=285029 /ORGANISM="Togula jolla, Strain CCCM 725" /LENGTH=122 /DNA_ID=CAMNT_0010892755 /DNA_START=272 /DNA_END=642 /DNA_ORIENTATION=+
MMCEESGEAFRAEQDREAAAAEATTANARARFAMRTALAASARPISLAISCCAMTETAAKTLRANMFSCRQMSALRSLWGGAKAYHAQGAYLEDREYGDLSQQQGNTGREPDILSSFRHLQV